MLTKKITISIWGADNIGKVSEADAALMAGTWNLVAGEANGQPVKMIFAQPGTQAADPSNYV